MTGCQLCNTKHSICQEAPHRPRRTSSEPHGVPAQTFYFYQQGDGQMCRREEVEILASCCCPQHLQTQGYQLLWAAAGHHLPLLKLWTAPPEIGDRRKGTNCVNWPPERKPLYLATLRKSSVSVITTTVRWHHTYGVISHRTHLILTACSNTPSTPCY